MMGTSVKLWPRMVCMMKGRCSSMLCSACTHRIASLGGCQAEQAGRVASFTWGGCLSGDAHTKSPRCEARQWP